MSGSATLATASSRGAKGGGSARRDRAALETVRGSLREYVGTPPPRPDGAFYAFLPLAAAAHPDLMAFCVRLRDEASVVFSSRVAFGDAARHHGRLSFAASEQQVRKGLSREALRR
jgi:aspartate/methionine/tyrosine aminotransferase